VSFKPSSQFCLYIYFHLFVYARVGNWVAKNCFHEYIYYLDFPSSSNIKRDAKIFKTPNFFFLNVIGQ
jgi:hypothetical protein